MDSNPASAAPLQFDTAVPTVTPSATSTTSGVTCATCQRAITTTYFDVNGQSVCGSCQVRLARSAETPRSWGLFFKAAAFGMGAAIAGAILYYAVIRITNFEIGIVAIAIGYMVGWMVRKGAGGRGGRRFQVLAIVLTYWSVGLAYTPMAFGEADESGQTETQVASTEAQVASTDAQVASTDEVVPAESPADAAPVNLPVALAALSGLSFALPVLIIVGSLPGGLISGAIIAFGMQQAWRLTGAPALAISGPYRIAAPPPPAV